MALHLLCDEHIPYPVVEGLCRRDLDVITVQEMGLSSAEDMTIMERAREEGWVIYTRNADFLQLNHAGI
jgi:predicted nuclease of predicted toxin-antitoxin system